MSGAVALPTVVPMLTAEQNDELTDIASVGGKLHIFFANFDGLVAGQNAVQRPQQGIRVSFAAAGRGKAWFLPFLGEAVPLQGQRQSGRLVFVLPEVQKGAVVWFEE